MELDEALHARRAARARRSQRRWLVAFGIAASLVVTTAAGLYITTHVKTSNDRQRLDAIHEEMFRLPVGGDEDATWKKIQHLEEEEQAILARHPDWRR